MADTHFAGARRADFDVLYAQNLGPTCFMEANCLRHYRALLNLFSGLGANRVANFAFHVIF